MIINHFFFVSQAHSQLNFCIFFIRMTQEIIKRGSRERQIARNGKLQYLFQKQFQSLSNEHNINKFSLLTECAYMTLGVRKNAPEERLGLELGLGAIFLVGNCPRTMAFN